MFDYDLLFRDLQKKETCKVLNAEEIKHLEYSFFDNSIVWEIDTVISYKGKSLSIVLYVNFSMIFPYSFPKFFIDKKIYNTIKFIPHINKDYSICIFDDGLNNSISIESINDILEYMIHQAKRIITSSEDEDYKKTEFKREFKAYWEIEYHEKDKTRNNGLHLINSFNSNTIIGIKLRKQLNGYEYILYNEGTSWDKFKKYLEYLKIEYDKISVIVIENIFTSPPYDLTFKQSLEILKNKESEFHRFKKDIKISKLDQTIIVFPNTVNDKIEIYGWLYKDLIVPLSTVKGTRKNLGNFEIIGHSIFGKSNVLRVTFDNLTTERLQLRTSGVLENHKTIVVSGVGSIGSNLIHFLQNFPINKFHLIDSDVLKLENINRHYSGFRYINHPKVDAIKDQIIRSNPFCEIEVKKDSIQKTINKCSEFINKCDFHIVAIGNTMVENFILKSLAENKLTSPIIIFWVEPYLASGHMIFINPMDADRALFLINNYAYNVLAKSTRQSELIYLKEGSCQSGFFPYSSTNLLHFLSSIFPYLRSHLIDGNTKSMIYTWIGDKELLKSKNLELTDFSIDKKSFNLIINHL